MVPDVARRAYPDLRFIVYGASPIAAETLRRAIEVFGCDFAQGYGMTETTAGATFLLPKEHERALAVKPELLLSCGRPLPGTEVRVVDADDRDVPLGSVGEILIRGPQLMRGYWNLPEATAEALGRLDAHRRDAVSRHRRLPSPGSREGHDLGGENVSARGGERPVRRS
jgi:acyl-CoA synthetase (AMP-forming)/AMP-acid ligase II